MGNPETTLEAVQAMANSSIAACDRVKPDPQIPNSRAVWCANRKTIAG